MYPGSGECLLACHAVGLCWLLLSHRLQQEMLAYLSSRQKAKVGLELLPAVVFIVLCLCLPHQTTFARDGLFMVLREFDHLLIRVKMNWMVMATNAGGRQSRN